MTMMSVIFFAKGVVETVKTELGSRYLMFMGDGCNVANLHETLLK
jgi:hypothetical protein